MAVLALLALLAAVPAAAQDVRLDAARVADLVPAPGILRNAVSNLHAEGDSLWVGPYLNLTTDDGLSWVVSDADSLVDSRNRVFSLDVEGDVVWAGLGFDAEAEGEDDPVATAAGFLVSTDGGETFDYRLPPLDMREDDRIVYGRSTLEALPVVVPQQSPPFDIDYDPATGDVWTAGWASGIRRSRDGGRSWERVVLPPDHLDFVHPDSLYDFVVAPERGGEGHRNHMGFSVLVDETGAVWAGTAAGLNRSTDGGRSWRRFTADGTAASIPGSWIVTIEEQPLPGRNPVWIGAWGTGDEGDRYGVAVTRDGGQTFEPMLVGEEVIDFAFDGATAYVAGRERGLLISDDGGLTWRTVRDFGRGTGEPVRTGLDVQSVAVTPEALWVGTTDGLFQSRDGGLTWRLFRAAVPVNPEEPTDAVPDVATYAYPNPFSPSADAFVRIRYELDRSAAVEVHVFDFGMDRVRRIDGDVEEPGEHEVTWDGRDEDGLRVANGVYFYVVRAGDASAWGKVQVLE